MADSEKNASSTFEDIVSRTHGVSHLERIVGIYYNFGSDEEEFIAGETYLHERATGQDLFFPSVFTAIEANPDFHIFLANFLEQQPDSRVFIGLDTGRIQEARYMFDLFVVGKTRLCTNPILPSIDASLIGFGTDFDEDFHDDDLDDDESEPPFSLYAITHAATVWEQFGELIKRNLIVEGIDVDTAVLIRMILDGTEPILRILIATHPKVTTPLLKAILEQTDPTEYHLLDIIARHPAANDEVLELVNTLGDE
jgi:hypothetical protein